MKQKILFFMLISVVLLNVFFIKNIKSDLDTGLMAYYNFDENSGSILTDKSNYVNNGLITNPIWNSSIYGYALNFTDTAINKYVTITDTVFNSPMNQMTLSCFVYCKTYAHMGIVWKHSFNYRLYVDDDYKVYFIVTDTSGVNSVAYSNNVLPLNTWISIICVFGADKKAAMYINGQKQNSAGNAILDMRDNAGSLFIGKRGDNYGYSFKGLIDEVRIYNKALSDIEILTLYFNDPRGTLPITPTLTDNINEFFEATLFNSESYLSYISLLIILVVLAFLSIKVQIIGFIASVIVSFALLSKYVVLLDSEGNFAYQVFIVLFNLIFSFIFLGLSKAKRFR